MVTGQSPFDVLTDWSRIPDQSNSLYMQLLNRAEYHLDQRDSVMKTLTSYKDWEDRQKWIRDKLETLVGPFPEKTPLRPTITGIIDQPTCRIEKLYYESREGFYVTGALFLPKNIPYPAPAILFCSGHSLEGFRSDTYQHLIFNYVNKGFIVLAFDPIGQGERCQYFDSNGHRYLSATHEHSYPGNQIFLTGVSPANYFIWDAIRSIDYLLTRPEVDHERIGVTGRSGGGTQTAYLMAFDDRIAAAAPECYMTSFEKLLQTRGPQDAEQNINRFLGAGLDLADLVIVQAPRPTLIIATTRDIFNIQGTRDLFREAGVVYQTFDFPDNLQMVEDDAGHTSTKKNREAAYSFFRKHLNNPGLANDEQIDTLPVQELWVTPTGSAVRDLQSETLFSLNRKHSQDLALPVNNNQLTSKSAWLRDTITSLLNLPKFSRPAIIFSGRDVHADYTVEKYLLRNGRGASQGPWLPLVLLTPKRFAGKTIMWLDEDGKASHSNEGSPVMQLLEKGHQLLLADLSGFGEVGGGYQGGDAFLDSVPVNVWYAGILCGSYPLTIRLKEIAWLKYFANQHCRQGDSMHVVATGTICHDVWHAAALQIIEGDITLIEPLVSTQSIVDTKHYDPKYLLSAIPGSIQLYDSPSLTGLISANVNLINAVDGKGQRLESSPVKTYFSDYGYKVPNVIVTTVSSVTPQLVEVMSE